ncbi:DNA mismatch repair protein pms1 [Zymoseptoria brevis]|uniref:DNA mismatch repair protein PMS1 n=1 Tax=Zymoseptoria brevis TaxID=1047168 RepID=A0A0F4GCI1_9PEZI|nr:DNA mismatch repair protein pms1 [Zymoseptoria brevis]
MATIKAIEQRSVHQIQSGQVIVDLNSVVKELVENSLDAGATSIEIRFKNQGLDSIEVQDNGKGIAPDDYDTVALKHHTSKLSTYEDLTSLDTFGFRGEALSSLCALSKFRVLTARTEDGAIGKLLEFEVSGRLKGTSVTAAQRGTTVFVEDIFHNLPVRRKELEKNVKRDYTKAITLLYAYACISVGVRFTVSNLMPKGKKVIVFSTKSNTTTKENITNVFGTKTLLALIRLDLHLEMEPRNGPSTQGARNWSTQAADRAMEVRVEGHISRPVFGEGRQAPDRQMFFVNSRPCGLPQVAKAFNEVYKSFNVSQSPFVFANLIMDTNAYDVNVSPDKRTIMLHDQTALLESLKTSLAGLFENTDHTVPQSTLPARKLPAYQPLTVSGPSAATKASPSALSDDDEESADEAEDSKPLQAPHAARSISSSNLIHDWVGRDCEPRKELRGPRRANTVPSLDVAPAGDVPPNPEKALGLTLDAQSNAVPATMAQPDVAVDGDPSLPSASHSNTQKPSNRPRQDAVINPDPLSTPYGDLFSQIPPMGPDYARQLGASNEQAQVGERAAPEPQEQEAPPEPAQSDEEMEVEDKIQDAPSLPSLSRKTAPGGVQNAFDRMRPNRTPLQSADIIVGDTKTTTVIGNSPPYKKRRIHKVENSQAVAKFGASPLLAMGLRRNFAAPGSQLHMESSAPSADGTDNESDDDASDADENGAEMSDNAKTPIVDVDTSEQSPSSDPLDDLAPAPANDDEWDETYVDEAEERVKQDAKIARLIHEAEIAAASPTEENLRRATQMMKNSGNRKDSTLRLTQTVETSSATIAKDIRRLNAHREHGSDTGNANATLKNAIVEEGLGGVEAEDRLSLTVSKSDFARMRVVGQFNLGFVLALRCGGGDREEDDLFIIDQHAADEKYNYERLQRTVTLQSQRLVRPKVLELTAVEQEIIINHSDALKANGFDIESSSHLDEEDDEVGTRECRLLTLPMSKEKTFDLSDLEELLHLLSEAPANSAEIPRPKKVQKMLAMRACRSSIMVGRTLTKSQMRKVVVHMGEMEKPWNCPHGRPTMRHLAGLGTVSGWQEGDPMDDDDDIKHGANATQGISTDWAAWLKARK